MTIRRLSLFLPVAAALALAAGCGGGGNSGATDPTEWADSLCGSVDTWATSIRSTTSTLGGGNVSKESLTSAAGDIKDTTDTLADDLKGLGKPDIETGDQAKQSVDELSTEYKSEAKGLQDTVRASGAVKAASSVRTTLTTMSSQLQTTFANLQKLDTNGELEEAFRNASACKALSSKGG
jgi:hypothetical protein